MFEYVASGLSFLRVNFKDTHTGDLPDKLNALWSSIRGKYNHEFSFLYNAYIEKHFGEVFHSQYRGKGINQIYADSGGLQIITLGKKVTPELKQLVYQSQGLYSDCAMSFDEIPVSIINSGRSSRSELNNKYFDRSRFEWCARESGRNIKTQIETFIEMKSDAKPMFIVQGGDCASYSKWVELALEEIPQELHDHIGGVAMGSGGIGNGTLEDCKRAFYYTQLPLENKNKHLHLLGIGSVSRMIPFLAFVNNGLYKDIHLSYDSTTHTSGVEMGRYYGPDFSYITAGRDYERNHYQYAEIHADIQKNIPGYTETVEFYHEAMNTSVRKYQAKYGDASAPILAYNVNFTSSVLNFLKHVDSINQDFMQIQHVVDDGEMNALNELRNVKTLDQFEYWERGFGTTLKSQPVRDGLPTSLPEDF